MRQPIKYESTSNLVYRKLLKEIIEGNITPGSRLIEEKLAKDFGVSRTPVREAFHKLVKDNLLEVKPRCGVFTKRFEKRDLIEIYQIRAILESNATKLAITNIPKHKLEKVKKMFGKGEAAKGELRRKLLSESDIILHNLIINYCGNERLKEMLKNLRDVVNLFRKFLWNKESYLIDTLPERKAVLEALFSRDGKTAAYCLRQHIEKTENRILKNFFGEMGEGR